MTKKKDFEKYKEITEGNHPQECQLCGGPLFIEKVNLEDYQGGKLYMMEKVPAFICQDCGETWVPEPIILDFEKMIETAKNRNTKHKRPPPPTVRRISPNPSRGANTKQSRNKKKGKSGEKK